MSNLYLVTKLLWYWNGLFMVKMTNFGQKRFILRIVKFLHELQTWDGISQSINHLIKAHHSCCHARVRDTLMRATIYKETEDSERWWLVIFNLKGKVQIAKDPRMARFVSELPLKIDILWYMIKIWTSWLPR